VKNLISIVVVCLLAWYGYTKYQSFSSSRSENVVAETSASAIDPSMQDEEPTMPAFSCDGRTRCSEMRSCEEATFFVQQCSGAQMDGDGDGVPCESQWCGGG
jgi:hypothetical protein